MPQHAPGYRRGRYETLAPAPRRPHEMLAEPDGARIETLPNGWTRVTLPDPPHFRPDARTRAAAALELRRRQLALLGP